MGCEFLNRPFRTWLKQHHIEHFHTQNFNTKATIVKTRFHYERGKEHSLFVLLIFFALASTLTARFNRRSIKKTKNALFHARSGNGPLRSLKEKLWRYFTYTNTGRYVGVMPALVESYNNTYHRSIQCAPNSVNAENQETVWLTLYADSELRKPIESR